MVTKALQGRVITDLWLVRSPECGSRRLRTTMYRFGPNRSHRDAWRMMRGSALYRVPLGDQQLREAKTLLMLAIVNAIRRQHWAHQIQS